MLLMKKKSTFRILTTTDIHGHVLPINYADNREIDYGMSHASTIIKKMRNKNTVVIDLGDILQGSPLMYFHQLNRNKYSNPVADVMNHIGYDYFIPGNHDFNYGLDYLLDFTNNLQAKTLCGNIYKNDDTLLFKKAYDIVKLDNGPKIAIIGLTTQYIPNWENPAYIKDLVFINAYESLKEYIKTIKEEADLIVVAYHGGFERDIHTKQPYIIDTGENLGSQMIENIPEIDVFISAHQHRKIAEVIENKIIVQSGSRAEMVGKIDIEFTFDNKWTVNNKKAELLLSKDYLPDKKTYCVVKDIEEQCQIFLDQVIGNVIYDNLEVKDMFKARLNKHPIVTFINKVQFEYSKAMISATSLPNEVTGFSKNITVRNVLSTYIYANTLTVLEINGKILKEILEKNSEYFICENNQIKINEKYQYPKVQHYNYDMYEGIDYTINIDKDFGSRIEELKYQNKEILPDQKFTLVVNNYRASGGGDFLEFKDLKIVRQIPFDITELIIDYIIKHKNIETKPLNNIKIVSENC